MYGGPNANKDHCLVDPQIRQSLVNQCTTTNMLEASSTKHRNPTIAQAIH